MLDEYTPDTLPDNAVIVDDEADLSNHTGTVYTQVDAGQDVVYLKGRVRVNRTGIYAVIPTDGE